MDVAFSKYEGTGNDFIVIDDRSKAFPLLHVDVSQLCHRQRGIGADGLILLQPSQRADFSMRIFNANNTEAEMCGNGLRCLVDFLYHICGEAKTMFNIETLHKDYLCRWMEQSICVEMGVPEVIYIQENEIFVNVGVPHLVVFVDDLGRFDKEVKERFLFSGVNINYAILNDIEIVMRTFERGVERETLSCGTGATAVCCAAYKKYGLQGSIKVKFLSGEGLTFFTSIDNNKIKNICMMGQVHHVFKGVVKI